MGFSLLAALEKEKVGRGRFLADSLGDYVGQNFTADQKDPKYKGQYGLTDAFAADTSKNALTWWEKHRL